MEMICIVCKKPISPKSKFFSGYDGPICSDKCFMENFWGSVAKNPDYYIIVDGNCYWDDGDIDDQEQYNLKCLGCDGHRFYIQMLNNKSVFTTNNLWLQGTIPDEYRSKLPDNAKFISQEKFEKCINEG